MIRINKLSKVYTMKGHSVNALTDIDLHIEKGEFVAVVGASGSGKSTLMNIMGCLDAQTKGSYLLEGVDVSTLSQKQLSKIRSKKIGFVFQGFNLIPTLTAFENVGLALSYSGLREQERSLRAMNALERVGLSERAFHKPSELSGGQQQRVAIARALASDTPVLLADEPCGNLDSKSGGMIMDMLSTLHREGRTVVLITHDDRAAMRAQRRIRICDGKIAAV